MKKKALGVLLFAGLVFSVFAGGNRQQPGGGGGESGSYLDLNVFFGRSAGHAGG